jgi:hypothetical protein
MTPEGPDPRDERAGADTPDESREGGEAYSEDEEAAVAARLEDLGYI